MSPWMAGTVVFWLGCALIGAHMTGWFQLFIAWIAMLLAFVGGRITAGRGL